MESGPYLSSEKFCSARLLCRAVRPRICHSSLAEVPLLCLEKAGEGVTDGGGGCGQKGTCWFHAAFGLHPACTHAVNREEQLIQTMGFTLRHTDEERM